MNEPHEFLYDYSDVGIPSEVTLSAYTSRMEKLRLSSDDLHGVMIREILPQVVNPKIDIKKLYAPDYYLMLRHLRILTWGPFWTAQSWICTDCINPSGATGKFYDEPRQINLTEVPVLCPEDHSELVKTVTIKKDEFMTLDADVKLHLKRCQDILFHTAKVKKGYEEFRPLAASISSVSGMDFVDISEAAEWLGGLPAVDEEIIEQSYRDTFNVGLRDRIEFRCPKCGGRAWAFVPINDYYFRPSKEDLKEWRSLLASPKKSV